MRLVIRRGTIVALALLLGAAAVTPSCLAACCAPSSAVRMMASMPCCAGAPALRATAAPADRPDATLSGTSLPRAPLPELSALVAPSITPGRTGAAPLGWDTVSGAAPPIFLRDAQFRI